MNLAEQVKAYLNDDIDEASRKDLQQRIEQDDPEVAAILDQYCREQEQQPLWQMARGLNLTREELERPPDELSFRHFYEILSRPESSAEVIPLNSAASASPIRARADCQLHAAAGDAAKTVRRRLGDP